MKIKKAMEMLQLGQGAAAIAGDGKDSEAAKKTYKFWSTQVYLHCTFNLHFSLKMMAQRVTRHFCSAACSED